jgi:hypothetical protein
MTMPYEQESLAAVLAHVADEAGRAVMQALHHAGLAAEVPAGSLRDIALAEAHRGAKSVPEESAQGWALWGLVMYLRGVEAVRTGPIRDPEGVGEWFANAALCAAKALATPVPEAVSAPVTLATGMKTIQETERQGVIGLATAGYASTYGEVDAEGEVMGRDAFAGIFEEWAADPRPPLYWEHGRDEAIGWRPIGYATDVHLDDTGLYVCGWLPREPDPARFTGAAASRQRAAYELVRTGKARGYSVGGTRRKVGQELRQWNTNDVSVGRVPILASARFMLRPTAGSGRTAR